MKLSKIAGDGLFVTFYNCAPYLFASMDIRVLIS